MKVPFTLPDHVRYLPSTRSQKPAAYWCTRSGHPTLLSVFTHPILATRPQPHTILRTPGGPHLHRTSPRTCPLTWSPTSSSPICPELIACYACSSLASTQTSATHIWICRTSARSTPLCAKPSVSSTSPDLSGYRVALKRNQGGAVGSIFNQEYGSDKNLTAHKSQHGSAKIVTGHQAVQGSPPKVVGQMYDMFRDAGDSLSCSARIEHRVPLDNERGVFMSPLPAWVLNASLLVFEVADWWYVHLSPCFLICIGRLRGEWHLGDGDLSGFMP